MKKRILLSAGIILGICTAAALIRKAGNLLQDEDLTEAYRSKLENAMIRNYMDSDWYR